MNCQHCMTKLKHTFLDLEYAPPSNAYLSNKVMAYDAAKSKQGKFMPGSHIPILSLEFLSKNNPDFLLILLWNIVDEVKLQNNFLIESGVKFVITVPNLTIK